MTEMPRLDGDEVKTTESQFKIYQCRTCGFVYDEQAGAPEEGLPPGTRWEDVTDEWICPACGATKADFDMVEIDRA
ncbi:rubredoxin [Bradyrhizobium sp. HKCCYLS20291]|uniref:rubredoxin n=1 Tax=Bradyrhizobium sp. HKCCYLS20291 TaxID=3420766 RepID=UPI003EB90243